MVERGKRFGSGWEGVTGRDMEVDVVVGAGLEVDAEEDGLVGKRNAEPGVWLILKNEGVEEPCERGGEC